MKHFKFLPSFREQVYIHSEIDGNLYCSADKKNGNKPIPGKVREAFRLCNQPYDLPPFHAADKYLPHVQNESEKISKRLMSLCKFNFWIATRYASFSNPIHEDSREAVSTFRNIISNQKDLCLPRALYAAKTSVSFDKHGVIIIGAALPSRSMHAWVIEEGELVDNQDREWLHHLPVAALY
jgi:hypothetical protein